MQDSFDFARPDIATWRMALRRRFGKHLPSRRRTPLGQLVKSTISSRTRDAVSTAAYDRLARRFPGFGRIADVSPAEVAPVIADVTFPEDKAKYLVDVLTIIRRERSDLELEFLGEVPVHDALIWLERLPGTGRKVAASTLNASTLARPVFIVDTHVLRVLQRLGALDMRADYRAGSELVTGAMSDWNGDDFLELHIQMKHLGQTVCHWDVPACAACPLASLCPTGGGQPASMMSSYSLT